jgi:uridylate kinase
MDNKLPIVVFDLTKVGNIAKAVRSPMEIGTVVGAPETAWA